MSSPTCQVTDLRSTLKTFVPLLVAHSALVNCGPDARTNRKRPKAFVVRCDTHVFLPCVPPECRHTSYRHIRRGTAEPCKAAIAASSSGGCCSAARCRRVVQRCGDLRGIRSGRAAQGRHRRSAEQRRCRRARRRVASTSVAAVCEACEPAEPSKAATAT